MDSTQAKISREEEEGLGEQKGVESSQKRDDSEKEVLSDNDEGSELSEFDEALKATQEMAEDYKDRWMRSVAEFENHKRRTAKEFTSLIQSASERVVRDLLPILDGIDRALGHHMEEEKVSEAYQEGVKMIMEAFPKVLVDHGLSEIEAVGQPFDPHYHEALMQANSEEYESGLVVDVVEKGYRLANKVVRHAKVVVSRGLPEVDDGSVPSNSE